MVAVSAAVLCFRVVLDHSIRIYCYGPKKPVPCIGFGSAKKEHCQTSVPVIVGDGSGWRRALSIHPGRLVPMKVSCQLRPCETAVWAQIWKPRSSPKAGASVFVCSQEMRQVFMEVQGGYVPKVQTGKPRCALTSLAWASAGLPSPPTTFLMKARGGLFLPLEMQKNFWLAYLWPLFISHLLLLQHLPAKACKVKHVPVV